MYLALLVIFCASFPRDSVSETDVYLKEAEDQCRLGSNPFYCAKFRSLQYVASLIDFSQSARTNSTGIIDLVKIDKFRDDGESDSARGSRDDGEFTKFANFLRRRIDDFWYTHGISFSFPEGMMLKYDDEEVIGRGTKKDIKGLVPLIILLKLAKTKVLLVVVLLGVIFIKKLLIIAAAFTPYLLHQLKSCKHHHHPHHHAEEVSYESESDGGYYAPPHYGKGWERAYRAHMH